MSVHGATATHPGPSGERLAPGWYQAGTNPNEQSYWTGTAWFGWRRWRAGMGWQEIDTPHPPQPQYRTPTQGPVGPWGTPGPYVARSATQGTNGLAIASLVLSIVGGFIGAILAVIFGGIARRQIRESGGTQGGEKLAKAGLIIGIVELSISMLVIVAVVALIAIGTFSNTFGQALGIAGAPGYTTVTGPAGLPLAEGSPWGHPCQPVVIQVDRSMPAAQYDLIRQAVYAAREAGVDVTIANPQLDWYPNQLYPEGQSDSTVKFVPIFTTTSTPGLASDGHQGNINIGWDANASSDGQHEALTGVSGTLYLSAVQGNAQATEKSVRQLVAMTQGVGNSTAPQSAITWGNKQTAYSARDIAAMQKMSGCLFEPTTSAQLATDIP